MEDLRERVDKLESRHHELDKRVTVAESDIKNIKDVLASIKANTSKTYYTLIITLIAIVGFFIKFNLF